VQRVLDILRPIFLGQRATIGSLKPVALPPDLSVSELATNEFLNNGLRLPSEKPSYYSSCKPQGNS
jgi:hypothetical protein